MITQSNMLLACYFAVYKTKAQPKFILASQTSTKLMAGISIYSVKNKEFFRYIVIIVIIAFMNKNKNTVFAIASFCFIDLLFALFFSIRLKY